MLFYSFSSDWTCTWYFYSDHDQKVNNSDTNSAMDDHNSASLEIFGIVAGLLCVIIATSLCIIVIILIRSVFAQLYMYNYSLII